MWNMYGLQLAPRSASELQPVLMNTVFSRFATWPIARPDADEISPMIIATLSRSIRRSALAEAVCGLTESSITSSILRPITPPASLISSAASFTPMTAYSPSGPRKPVSGVRCPMRMASACARTIAGMPTPASTAEPAALLMSVRRDRLELMAFLPSNSFMRFELAANVRVRRRLPPLLPTIAAARVAPPSALLATKCMYHSRSCDSQLAGDDREDRHQPQYQRSRSRRSGRAEKDAGRCHPRRMRADRDAYRLRARYLWRVHGDPRQRGGKVLPDVRGPGPGQAHPHGRRSRRRRQAASGTERVHRTSRASVRVLHARFPDADGERAGNESRPHG